MKLRNSACFKSFFHGEESSDALLFGYIAVRG
jgi:hypothetical protein